MLERKTFKFEIKQVDEEEGIIEGYGSTFSKIPDSYGDIVDEGAFTKTIKENSNNIVSLFNHYINDPIGKPDLSVDKKGLYAKIKIVRGVQKAEETLLLAKAGVITQMSIGYNTVKESWEKGIRHLQEVRLFDVSPVVFAANPEAVIIGVKKATSFGDLPLADRDKEWDAAPVEKRVRAWAGGEDNINWNKYRQAFFWYDEEDSELFGSYKLGFADIINNRLTAIPRGIFAVAAVLMGARGGVAIPGAEEAAVKAHVEKYYAKMRKEFDDEDIVAPWNKSAKADEMKPYPNEHACRLRDPDDFQDGSFRRTTRTSDGKKYSIIMGRLEGEDTMTEQAYRYDREVWDEGDAKAHCKDHDGTFEAAKEDKFQCECIECGHKMESKKHCSEIKCPECGGKMRRAERPGPGKSEQEKSGRVLSSASLDKLKAALEALQALLEAAESEPEPEKATQLSEEAAKEAAELEQIVNSLKAENEGFDTKHAEARIAKILEQLKKGK